MIPWLSWQTAYLFILIPPALIVVWWWARPLTRASDWFAFGLRVVAVVSMLAALAAPSLRWPSSQMALVVIRDRSASMSQSGLAQQASVVRQLQDAQPAQARFGVVDTAAQAVVAAVPAPPPVDISFADLSDTNGTALMSAIIQATTLLPAGYVPHILLLSDGNETTGRMLEMVDLLQARGIRVDAIPMASSQAPPTAAIRQLTAPLQSRGQGQVPLLVDVVSAIPQDAVLSVWRDQTLVQTSTITLNGSAQRVTLDVAVPSDALQRLTVTLTAPVDDTLPDNQRTLLLQRSGPPRILLLAGDPVRAEPLQAAFATTGSQVTLQRPTDVVAQLTELAAYDAIVLFDTPARSVPEPLMQQIATAVSELGRGFLWVGGADSFGAGGFRRSTLSNIAAVSIDPIDPAKQQRVQLILVIDRSGSMEQMAGAVSQLDLAKEAAFQAIKALKPNDAVAIAFFDDTAAWALPTTVDPDAETVAAALGRVAPGGGTSIRSGLSLAAQALQGSTADVRHVLLLSDGMDEQSSLAVARQIADTGATISTIAMGDGADQTGLAQIAAIGQGSAYVVAQPQQLPELFLSETVKISGYDVVEAEVFPQVVDRSVLPATLTRVAPLYGYNRTSAWPDSRVLLQIDAETPLWATRRVGRGVSAVWTSDLGGRWGRDWARSSLLVQLAPALLAQVLPPREQTLDVRWYWHDDILEIDLFRAEGAGTQTPELTLTAADGQSTVIALDERNPQQWRALVRDLPSGEYVLQVSDDQSQVVRGVVVVGRSEADPGGQGKALLAMLTAQTGGRMLDALPSDYWRTVATAEQSMPLAPWLYALAMLCFVGEIGLRRLGNAITVPRFTNLRRWVLWRPSSVPAADGEPAPSPLPPAPPVTHVSSLRQAKQKARDEMQQPTTRE